MPFIRIEEGEARHCATLSFGTVDMTVGEEDVKAFAIRAGPVEVFLFSSELAFLRKCLDELAFKVTQPRGMVEGPERDLN